MSGQMANVLSRAGYQIVDTGHRVAIVQQVLAEVRPNEPSRSRDNVAQIPSNT
jgi:hypothetical protein